MNPHKQLGLAIKYIDTIRAVYGDNLQELPEHLNSVHVQELAKILTIKPEEEKIGLRGPFANENNDFTLDDLLKRYNLSRVGLRGRLKALHMSPAYYKNNFAFFTRDQVELLDKLDDWRNQNRNGTFTEFCYIHDIY
jgi:hypothetical protein